MTLEALDLGDAAARPWDVVVIGAGPAGALAARQAAAGGARVLLIDKKTFPRPKVCGCCLNGKALAVLEAAGLGGLVDGLGGVELDRLELRLGGRGVSIALPAGKALAREILDDALVGEAIAAGAGFLPATTAKVEPGAGITRLVRLDRQGTITTVPASVVVVAAGLSGACFGHEPGMRSRVAASSRLGAGCTITRAPDAYGGGAIHMAVGRSGYVGLVRLRGGSLNVAAAFDRDFIRARGAPAAAAAAVLDEAGTPPVPGLADASWQGTAPLTRHTRPVAGHRLFLLGDAAGYVEPFTGEGMGAALTAALAAAPLILRGASSWDASLAAEWARLHHRMVGRHEPLCRALTLALRRPWLARRVFGLAACCPAVSRSLVRRVNEPPVSFEAN